MNFLHMSVDRIERVTNTVNGGRWLRSATVSRFQPDGIINLLQMLRCFGNGENNTVSIDTRNKEKKWVNKILNALSLVVLLQVSKFAAQNEKEFFRMHSTNAHTVDTIVFFIFFIFFIFLHRSGLALTLAQGIQFTSLPLSLCLSRAVCRANQPHQQQCTPDAYVPFLIFILFLCSSVCSFQRNLWGHYNTIAGFIALYAFYT